MSENFTDAARKQQSIETQLDIARRIQLGMVPEDSGLTAEGCDPFDDLPLLAVFYRGDQ